jgi:hypothetical protein
LADRWPGCRGYCQPGLDRSLGILAGEAFVEAGGTARPAAGGRRSGSAHRCGQVSFGDRCRFIVSGTKCARCAGSYEADASANIDPNRKTVANVTEQPPQQLIAFVGSIARTARTSAHSPTLGGGGENWQRRPCAHAACSGSPRFEKSTIPNAEKVARYNTLRF